MISIYNVDKNSTDKDGDVVMVELRGLSTDTKPTDKIGNKKIGNGSTFIEIDTGKIKFFDGESKDWIGE